jgi:uncharacterized protein
MIAKIGLVLLIVCCSLQVFSQTLSEAISKKDSVAAMRLIKSGTDVNAVDANGTSQLMNACRWADEWAVRFLLNHGAKPDYPKSPKGRTPLMVACAYYSGKSICSMLIEKGANVNVTAQDGITSLMLAAENAKLDVVELLLRHGANPNAKDGSGKTAYDYAARADVSEYLKKSVKDTRLDKQAVMDLLKKAMK